MQPKIDQWNFKPFTYFIFTLTVDQYCDLFNNIKGETSHWINQSNYLDEKFVWQTAYAAFSVSEST